MSTSIKGKKREATEDFVKKIGMVEVEVIAINPTEEEYKDVLGMELKEDSKAAVYLGESRDGNNYVRVDFWLQSTGDQPSRFKVSFFLEDKDRTNKAGDKQQFINDIGICSWGADEDALPTWFVKREYRNAKGGEEDFYSFLRTWISLDYRDEDTELKVDWKQLMKGNVKELKELVGDDLTTAFVVMATVSVKGEGEDMKEYQGVYNKNFLPSYTLRHFRDKDYNDPDVQAMIMSKETKDLKFHEKFVQNVIGEYGCKDIYSLGMLEEFNAEDHLVASDDAIGGEGVHDSSEY